MIRQLRINRRRDRRLTSGAHHERVAVGGLPHGVLHGKPTTGARLVFDDDRLAEDLRKLLPDQSGKKIVAAAGGKADDHPHGLVRIIGRIALFGP